ncbi:MAG: tetratricopeptide repeat protein, partial [Isosphaeraceae bacterium]|nr:tetratricopeptide repeat protein [Isosphaeraceae bacterium]
VAMGGRSWWRGRPGRHLAEAERLLDAGAPAEAVAWLDLPASRPATRDRALLLRARAALARRRPAEAVAPLEQVDPRGPWAAEAAFWKGRTLYAVGQFARAIPWYRAALARRPDDAEIHRWLAAAAYDLGDRDTAIAALREVTRLQPDDARAWRTLALIYKENRDLAQAEPAYRRSLALDPQQPRVRFEWSEVLVELGRPAEAERQLDASRGGIPEADRVALLARCRLARGDRDGARAVLEAALTQAPSHPGLLAEQAVLDQAMGRPAEAAARLDRALAAQPNNPQWLYQRGLALRMLGRAAEAQRDLERAAELNRDWAAMAALNDEAAQHPDDPEVRCRLGRLCARLGLPELAASWYRAALACDPHCETARLGLATLRSR